MFSPFVQKLAPLREEVACRAILAKLQNTPNLIPGTMYTVPAFYFKDYA